MAVDGGGWRLEAVSQVIGEVCAHGRGWRIFSVPYHRTEKTTGCKKSVVFRKVAADLESLSVLEKSLDYFIVESLTGFSKSILR